MQRFVLQLLMFVVLFSLAVVGMHVYAILKFEKEIQVEYSLRPDQDVLFVGSSQIGCSIVESPCFHNKVIWTSSKPIQSTLARLLEMERRGCLDSVKVCAIRLNRTTIGQQNTVELCRAWYNEFPFSWRYASVYCCAWWQYLAFAVSHLRYPFLFGINDVAPRGRPSIAERDEVWRKHFFSVIDAEAKNSDFGELIPDWQNAVDKTLVWIKEICERHQIRLVALDIPFLPHCVKMTPKEKLDRIARWKDRVKRLGVEFVDVEGVFDESCYFDEVHMVERGAERYTRLLYRQLDLPF